MKKILATITIMLFAVSMATSVSAANLTADISYSNKYIGAAGNTIYDGEVTQECFTLSAANGIYGGLFFSQSPDGRTNNNFGDEIDYFLGYARNFGKLKADLYYSYFNLYDLGNTYGDLQIARGTFTYDGTFYLLLEHDFPKDKEILPGGNWYQLGAAKEIAKNITLDLSVLGHDSLFDLEDQSVSSARAGVIHQASENVTVKFFYQKHLGRGIDEGGLSQDAAWLVLNYRFSKDL